MHMLYNHRKPKLENLVDVEGQVNLLYAVMFSVKDISKCLEQYICTQKNVILRYENVSVVLDTPEISQIRAGIEKFQMRVVSTYETDSLMYLWLLYSRNDNYRKRVVKFLESEHSSRK